MTYLPSIAELKAAISLLEASQVEVAKGAGISEMALNRHMTQKTSLRPDNAKKLMTYLDNKGVEFIEGGVRKQRDYFKNYKGSEGFKEFMDHVYYVAQNNPGEFCLYNARPSNWIKWMGEEWNKMHSARMAALENKPRFRITSQQGDTNLIGNRHAEYRWIPDELWHDQAIYIYGGFIGFMTFKEDAVTIKVFQDDDVYKNTLSLFNHVWNTASIIPEGVPHKPA